MPITKTKISYFYDLSEQLEKANSKAEREAMKRRAGDILLDEIFEYTSNEKSPVKNQRSFKPLSPEYKKLKKAKGKGDKANLILFYDMLPSMKVKPVKDGFELKITDPLEKKKAFNHNTPKSGVNTSPKRQFIPKDDQDFKTGIKKKIDSELNKVHKEFNSDD